VASIPGADTPPATPARRGSVSCPAGFGVVGRCPSRVALAMAPTKILPQTLRQPHQAGKPVRALLFGTEFQPCKTIGRRDDGELAARRAGLMLLGAVVAVVSLVSFARALLLVAELARANATARCPSASSVTPGCARSRFSATGAAGDGRRLRAIVGRADRARGKRRRRPRFDPLARPRPA